MLNGLKIALANGKTFGLVAAAAAAALLNVTASAAYAQDQQPGPGEVRLTVNLNGRSVSFLSALEPMIRKTVLFEARDYAPTDDMRRAVAEMHGALAALPAQTAIVVTAYASDEVVAYRRARAIRGDLIERHQMEAGRIIAAGRVAPGHDGGATIVDIQKIDPAECGGCGATPFRTIALDTGTMRLVTVLPEMLTAGSAATVAENGVAPAEKAAEAAPARNPAPQAGSVPSPAAPRPKAAPAQRSTQPVASAPQQLNVVSPPPRPVAEAAAPRQRAVAARAQTSFLTQDPYPARQQATGGGCPRPRIIIDDYYPGGPMVPCRTGARQ